MNTEQLKAACEMLLTLPDEPTHVCCRDDRPRIKVTELQALATAYLEQTAMLEAAERVSLPETDLVKITEGSWALQPPGTQVISKTRWGSAAIAYAAITKGE